MPKGPAGRRIAVQAVLLALALIWAYWAAHPDKSGPGRGGESFTLWSLDADEIKQISVRLEKAEVDIAPEPGDEGSVTPYLWITAHLREPERRRPPRRPPGDDGGDDADGGEPRTLVFKGNRSAETAFQNLTALEAERRLGPLADVQGEAFGLPTEQEYLEVQPVDGEPLRINLGGTTYGDTYRYVHFTRDDNVYLIKQSVVQSLARSPGRMADRNLFPSTVTESARVELRYQGKAVSFWRLAGGEEDDAEWADSEDAAEGEEAVQTWIRDLGRLKGTDYLDTEPPLPADTLDATVHAEGQPEAWLKMFQNAEGDWLARTSYTRRTVRLGARPAQALADAAKALLQAR